MAERSSEKRRRRAVADALHSAAIHLLRRVRAEDEEAGVGPARLSALSVLVFGGPQRLTDLARTEQVRPPTMTKVVTGLEQGGLARRVADPDDARAVRVEATARGRALLVEGRRRRVERLARGLTTLLPHELDVLAHAAAIMERVSARM
jgi:DNA-binding MarR family transcriptional regulator